ncbi:MAG: L-dopachrome tautomerase-related protein [Anaerolineaceae bacterium]
MKRGEYEILFHWNHLDWIFPNDKLKTEFEKGQYWKGAMAAGFKLDRDGNNYLSVPRWAPGIPATVNKIEIVNGKAMLKAYPNWEMNEIGNPAVLQSVLGWNIDENNIAWFLDQGHIEGQACLDGAQKLVAWDVTKNTLVGSYKIPEEIASYTASFLNDLMIDNLNGFIYIADSGIFSDPLEGGIIVFNMNTEGFRRVLHQHVSVQDVPGYWFEIAGKKIWNDGPMRTGADGIALSADRKTLYWCPLTSKNLYGIDTSYLQDFNISNQEIENAVQDFGDKGTNTDGMCSDNQGLIYYTMLEGQGIGTYDPVKAKFEALISDKRMIWVDGMTFDNQGYLLFNNNRLHELFRDELDWNNQYNLVIWKAYLGQDIKSYMQFKA